MNSENHVVELLPGYALNILTEEETIQAANHLVICTTCQAELRAYQAVAEDLPLALSQMEPPIKLKKRLMEEIHSRHTNAAIISKPTLWQRWTKFIQPRAAAWSLISLALFLALLMGNLALWQNLTRTSHSEASAMRVVALAGTNNAPQAIGKIIISQNGDYGTLVVDNLVALDATHQYQLWLIRDGKRTSGGVFSTSADGYTSILISAPLPLNQYQTFGITIEPTGGSPGPTGVKVLGGSLE